MKCDTAEDLACLEEEFHAGRPSSEVQNKKKDLDGVSIIAVKDKAMLPLLTFQNHFIHFLLSEIVSFHPRKHVFSERAHHLLWLP
jgi:hypothetical protein